MSSSNAVFDAESCSEDDGCLCKTKTKKTAKAKTDNHNLLAPPVLAFSRYSFKQQNSKGKYLSSRPTKQPTAASAHPLSSHAEREGVPSSEAMEQKMVKLEQASSQNASAFAESRSQEDDCMNENGKYAKTPVRASPGHPHQVRFHN